MACVVSVEPSGAALPNRDRTHQSSRYGGAGASSSSSCWLGAKELPPKATVHWCSPLGVVPSLTAATDRPEIEFIIRFVQLTIRTANI
jgi:hypothetical protein